MIIYDLLCENDHRMEGWFSGPEDYESQLDQGLIRCPHCDTPAVRRVPSAVALASGTRSESTAVTSVAALPEDSQAMGLYRQLVGALMASTEDVGTAFAEEARKIHYREAPERGIRGSATDEEFDALRDEGIELIRLPIVAKRKLS
ncbi:MAG: DUF1178 family protein [Dechloromonas sp.]|jgi:hypothetical protein|nr:DUF1178 family protein [Dechloromonas sp.]